MAGVDKLWERSLIVQRLTVQQKSFSISLQNIHDFSKRPQLLANKSLSPETSHLLPSFIDVV